MRQLRWVAVCVGMYACGESTPNDGASNDSGAISSFDAGQGSSLLDAQVVDGGGTTSEAGAACSALTTQQARVACAANAVLATLSASERTSINLDLTDYTDRTKWNNLPVMLKPRAGVQMGSLGATSQAAVLELMNIALNSNGQQTMTGILRADDYLKTMQGGYGSDLYSIAIYGAPSATGDFEVMFGGHHMAYNLNFVGGSFYPVPQHLGCEPKAAFTIGVASYEPLSGKGNSMFAIYDALDTTQRSTAYLAGQTFSDVIVNPDLDYGKGQGRTSKTAYPTGGNRTGVLVSNLSVAQQALVTTAIEQWARQYPSDVTDALMTAYTGGYGDTYFAWAGATTGPDKDVTGSYLRIDGPRVWIELTVQAGIVIRSATHYHTIYHDKMYDYGGQL
jgi:hypothetical protein